jgi:hypothetical protein
MHTLHGLFPPAVELRWDMLNQGSDERPPKKFLANLPVGLPGFTQGTNFGSEQATSPKTNQYSSAGG